MNFCPDGRFQRYAGAGRHGEALLQATAIGAAYRYGVLPGLQVGEVLAVGAVAPKKAEGRRAPADGQPDSAAAVVRAGGVDGGLQGGQGAGGYAHIVREGAAIGIGNKKGINTRYLHIHRCYTYGKNAYSFGRKR